MPERELTGKVTLEATVSPSEDPEKVAEAMGNVLGVKVEASGESKSIRFESTDIGCLSHFREQLRDRHVRAAARRLLNRGREGNSVALMLNRQAATVGVVALCGTPSESPLGPVYLRIDSKRLEEIIDWLTAYEEG